MKTIIRVEEIKSQTFLEELRRRGHAVIASRVGSEDEEVA